MTIRLRKVTKLFGRKKIAWQTDGVLYLKLENSFQLVHSFQLRLLRSEISQANANRVKASGNLAKSREVVRRCIQQEN